jgi:hypothetical protein
MQTMLNLGRVISNLWVRLGVPAVCLALNLIAPVRSDAITVHRSGYFTSLFSSTSADGMEIDPAGNLYFVLGASGVQRATPSGQFSIWSTIPMYEMALAPTGEGYATGGSCACIEAIRPDGTLDYSRVDSTGWSDLALTPDGALYGMSWRGSLARIDRTTLEATTIVLGGPGPGGSGAYGGIAPGADGRLYVSGTLDGTIAGWRLFRLEGSQLVTVATLPHGAGNLVPGPSGTFFGLTGFDYGSGYSIGEVWQIDPKTGSSELLVSSGSYFHNNHPTFHSLAYDSTRATLYVGEGGLGSGTWAIAKIPPIVVTWGEGSVLSVDTTMVRVQWPVQVQVNWLVDIYLERRTENGSFGTVQMNRASDGQVSFADLTVTPGTRYAYRAGAVGDSGVAYSGVLWVDVPALTPPPPPVQIWGAGAVAVDSSSVTLDWLIDPTVTGDVRVERRDIAGTYGSIASVHLAGDGHVHLVDETILPGASYVYRAGVPSDTGWVWSDELAADVPTFTPSPPYGYALEFARGASFFAQTSIETQFTVPAAGAARIEAFDVTGRRVAEARIDAAQAGTYTVQLGDGGAFKPGIYFLRLTQGAARAQSRAIVLGSR